MPAQLETERLILRRFTAADAEHLVELDGDPAVMRFLTGGAPTPRDQIEGDILPRFVRSAGEGAPLGFWAAIERGGGDFLGWFSLRRSEGGDPDEASLGYRLRRAAWGRGYATEGARALIRAGFAELGLRRVTATTYQENVASRRVMERVGMRLVRTFRLTPDALAAQDTAAHDADDLWDGDDVEYALTRGEWEAVERERAAR